MEGLVSRLAYQNRANSQLMRLRRDVSTENIPTGISIIIILYARLTSVNCLGFLRLTRLTGVVMQSNNLHRLMHEPAIGHNVGRTVAAGSDDSDRHVNL